MVFDYGLATNRAAQANQTGTDVPLHTENGSYPTYTAWAPLVNRLLLLVMKESMRSPSLRRPRHTSSKAIPRKFLGQRLDEHHCLDRGGRARRSYEETRRSYYLPTLKHDLSADAEARRRNGAAPAAPTDRRGHPTCSQIPLADRR